MNRIKKKMCILLGHPVGEVWTYTVLILYFSKMLISPLIIRKQHFYEKMFYYNEQSPLQLDKFLNNCYC